MSETKVSAAAFADTKPHYNILDGLRGVAALMVVWFHVFEAFATSHVDIIGISKIPLPNNRLSRCSLEISTKI